MAKIHIKHVTFGCDGESLGHEPCDIISNGGCSTRNTDLTVQADSLEEMFPINNEKTAEELVAAFYENQKNTTETKTYKNQEKLHIG